ncbi:NAD(P)-dependent oxidoreductase [Bacillus gobiensis]|uniref:NAD(P)-dependent oxidoreductase n=1 Tax=Bacillus gobiensis TaxID=1441095 RepID=UPI003D19AF52
MRNSCNNIYKANKYKQYIEAVMDVFQQESLPAESPLWECENLILTSHMTAKSIFYIDRCVEIFVDNVKS